MWENASHYEILGVGASAGVQEIKKAYFGAVRKYPPERCPEEFKRIREAYVTLSNPERRREYDDGQENGTIREYLGEAREAMDERRYQEALAPLQKALEISPGSRVARGMHALCLIQLEAYEQAIRIYKKLILECPDDPVFYYTLGEALFRQGALKQASEAFEASLRLAPDDLASWVQLGYCYFRLDNNVKARATLEKCLEVCGENVSVYLRLIQMDTYEDNVDWLKRDIRRLEKLAEDDPEMRENVAWSLVRTAESIRERVPDLAATLLGKAKKLNPDAEIKQLHKETSLLQKLYKSEERLRKDPAIHSWIKDLVSIEIARIAEGYDGPENAAPMQKLMLKEPANLLSSARRIKEEYPDLFKLLRKFLQTLLDNPAGVVFSESDTRQIYREIALLDGLNPDGIPLDEVYIPPMPRVKTVDVGRNEPCPCGSGKKYKKCCLGA